jgi:hypothetical protein
MPRDKCDVCTERNTTKDLGAAGQAPHLPAACERLRETPSRRILVHARPRREYRRSRRPFLSPLNLRPTALRLVCIFLSQ